jgi:hypothetical protein
MCETTNRDEGLTMRTATRILCVFSVALLLAPGVPASAALVHTDTLPGSLTSDRTLIYLDVELASQATSDTNNDPARTWFRTGETGCCWGSYVGGGARFANRGSGNQSHLNESTFWADIPTPEAGLWDVYIHHRLDSTVNDTTTLKSVTNTFYVGSGLSGSTLLDQALVGAATISSTDATPHIDLWDYLGPISLDGTTIDSFRLNLDAVYAVQRVDAVLLVRLPEPSTIAMLLGLGGVGLLASFRRLRRR